MNGKIKFRNGFLYKEFLFLVIKCCKFILGNNF